MKTIELTENEIVLLIYLTATIAIGSKEKTKSERLAVRSIAILSEEELKEIKELNEKLWKRRIEE